MEVQKLSLMESFHISTGDVLYCSIKGGSCRTHILLVMVLSTNGVSKHFSSKSKQFVKPGSTTPKKVS